MKTPVFAIDPASDNPNDVISYPYPNRFGRRINFLDLIRAARKKLENMESGEQLNFLDELDASLAEGC